MDNFFLPIPEYLSPILSLLEQSGFEAYLVGGCVRDSVMGRIPNDYDLTTSATPAEMCRVFSDFRLIETGLKHGTVTVCSDGEQIEITTYRIDGAYADNRHPESVSFTRNITEDLSRRDFTVNAMAYSPTRGLCDPFGGIADIERRRIACVGDAEKRFREDGLRIMRAVRFASCLDFTIDAETADAARSLSHLLDGISRERVHVEFSKLICGAGAGRITSDFADVLHAALPPVSEHTFKGCAPLLACLPADPVVRLAFLAANEDADGSASCAGKATASLKASTADSRRCAILAKECTVPYPETESAVKRLMSRLSHENILAYAAMHSTQTGTDSADFLRLYDAVCESDPCVSIKQLAVGGRDVMTLAGARGTAVGEILQSLLDRVMDGELNNDRETLCELLSSMRDGE